MARPSRGLRTLGEFHPTAMKCMLGFYDTDFGVSEGNVGLTLWRNPLSLWGIEFDDYAQATEADEMPVVSGFWPSGRDAIQGDGSTDYAAWSQEFDLMYPWSFFVGLRTTDLSADLYVASGSSGDGIIFDTGGRIKIRTASGVTTISSNGAISASTIQRVLVGCDAVGDVFAYVNGSDVIFGTPNITSDIRLKQIGCRSVGAFHHNAHYGHLGFAQRDLQPDRFDLDAWQSNWLEAA